LEIHEHRLLILDQDQFYDIECPAPNSTTTTQSTTITATRNENETEALEEAVDFDVEVVSAEDQHEVKIAQYGHSYNLKVNVNNPTDHRFRVHSCFARAQNTSVEVGQ
jgi:hypothetical protein